MTSAANTRSSSEFFGPWLGPYILRIGIRFQPASTDARTVGKFATLARGICGNVLRTSRREPRGVKRGCVCDHRSRGQSSACSFTHGGSRHEKVCSADARPLLSVAMKSASTRSSQQPNAGHAPSPCHGASFVPAGHGFLGNTARTLQATSNGESY
jgi:hypothetical protein